jgi:segregation and condensation protein A
LLYLVRKEEVDIYDIPIARITDQYLHYVELIKSLDVDLAGSFLVMAATLMHIKSAMLLPKSETEGGKSETVIDPRSELIRQLLEYKKFKDAANLLDAAADEAQSRFGRPATIIEKLQPDAEPEVDIEQVSIWDLLEAFDAVCKATGAGFNIGRITDETPIDLYQIEILARLQTEGPLSFAQIFEGKPNRVFMVGLFLALLELVRGGLISIELPARAGAYRVAALTDEPPEQAVQRMIASSDQNHKPAETQTDRQGAAGIAERPAIKQEPAPIPIVGLPALPVADKPKQTVYDDVPLSSGKTEQTAN